ncbi:MAG: hypothetical protein Q9O62_07650 [Ardenticatenia bacterium]|nr:hypothetical protein [Ardenticatenia bacterium]
MLYQVTLKDVKKPVLPALDDELAQMVGDFETFEELYNTVRTGIEVSAERHITERLHAEVLSKLVEISTVEYSPRIIEKRAQQVIERSRAQLQAQGITLEEYLARRDISYDEYYREVKERVEAEFKNTVVLQHYIRSRNITVSPWESLALLILETNMTPDDFADQTELEEAQLYYTTLAVLRKALKHLAEEVTGEPQPPLPEEEIAAQMQEHLHTQDEEGEEDEGDRTHTAESPSEAEQEAAESNEEDHVQAQHQPNE